ncbi:MAG: MFS transporter [Erysipelotrichaceae bacterium]|jgi:GPH family glycoside/pentoside/hexuronide:cation symporter
MAKNYENGYRKFGMLDKISYAAGDFGCNMSFALAGTWFTLFWTQYMKIDSLVFAGLLIVLKIWDAINDPIIGTYMDASNKNYKLGKFKHFINFGSYGLAISAALCFLPIPNAPEIVKIIICLLGYVAWDAFYTIVNVPYGSMLSVITSDPGERAQLGAWRTLGALFAGLSMGIFLPIILYDENRNIMGVKLFFVALVLGFIGWLSFKFMIKTTVQRVETPQGDENVKFNIIKSIKDFMNNRPALGATLLPVSMFLGTYGAATATTVMFQSYFQNTKISGLMSLIVMLPMMLFIPFVKKITIKYGKKEATAFGMIFSIVSCIAMIVIPMKPDMSGVLIYMILQLINGLGMGVGSLVGNAMMADAIDYNQWKTGKREEGITYSLHSFFRKAAQGIGPSVGLVLMVMLGYDEQLGAAQPFEVALKMRYLVAALYLLSAILMFVGVKYVYNLDKNTLDKMNKELGR